MPALVQDERIYETSVTTGTGEYTLSGAVTGFQPASVIGANNYLMGFVTDDTNWEAGIYTYVSGPDRLQRTHVVASSNSDAAVDWGAGTKKLRCGPLSFFAPGRQVSKSVAGSSDVTLTALEQACDQLILTGALTGDINVIVDTTKRALRVYNNTSGSFALTVKTSAGTGVVVKQGRRALVACDGTNVVPAVNQRQLRGEVLSRSSNTILGIENDGDTLLATGSYTQTLTAAATLGDGWFIDIIVDSGVTLTIDPNSTETIDGATTKSIIGPAQGRVFCNGTLFRTSGFIGRMGVPSAAVNLRGYLQTASDITIFADRLQLEDSNGNQLVVSNVSLQPSLAASGANGLDTGSEASNTWYYAWVIAKPDGTVAGLLSTSSSAPTMPSGYTFKALVSVCRNDGSSDLINYTQVGNVVRWLAPQQVVTSGTATTETSVSVSSNVPPNARSAITVSRLTLAQSGTATSNVTLTLRGTSGHFSGEITCGNIGSGGSSTASAFNSAVHELFMFTAQTIYYLLSTSTGSPTANVYVAGFTIPVGK